MFIQKINRAAGRHKVFAGLLIPYILFLILAMLVGWIIYHKTLLVVEKEETASNMNLLEQSKEILDRRFGEISAIAQQVANDPRIMQFQPITDPFVGANTFRILETRKSVYNFSLTNNFIYDYFIFFKKSELVLTTSSTYLFPEFYKTAFHYENFDYEQWYQLFFGSFYNKEYLPAQKVYVQGAENSMLTYIQTLGYPGYNQGAIAVLIDNKEIQKLLRGPNVSQGGWAYITDDQNRVISSVSSGAEVVPIDKSRLVGNSGFLEQTIGSQKMMVTYTKSAYNGWTYLVVQPSQVVLGKVRYIQKISFTMAFIFLVLGVFIAYILAYRNSKPLRSIMNTFLDRADMKNRHPADAYGFIREAVSGLIDNNDKMQAMMIQQAPLLQAALFERLLKGEFLSRKDTGILLQHVGIDINGKFFVVVIVHLCGFEQVYNGDILEELDIQRVLAKEILQIKFGENAYMYDVAEDKIALLHPCDSNDVNGCQNQLEKRIDEAKETMLQRLKLTPAFAIGGIYEGVANVSRSFEEAKQALNYQLWENTDTTVWFYQLPQEHSGYYYPGDLEIRLMNLAKSGEQADVEKLLKELYQANFTERICPFRC